MYGQFIRVNYFFSFIYFFDRANEKLFPLKFIVIILSLNLVSRAQNSTKLKCYKDFNKKLSVYISLSDFVTKFFR